MQIPTRSVYASGSDCDSNGKVYLNSTWGFVTGATVTVSATGKSSLECVILDVQPAYIQVRSVTSSGSAPANLSAYTLALNTTVTQPSQAMPDNGFISQIDPAQKCNLALLNAPLHYLGTINSNGTAKSNNDAGFYNTNQALKELVITVCADAACYIRPTTSSTNAADSTYEQLQAGEKRVICMGPTQGFISVIGVGGASVNLRVYRNYLV